MRRILLSESEINKGVKRCDCVFEDHSGIIYVLESGGFASKLGGLKSQLCNCVRELLLRNIVRVEEVAYRLRGLVCVWSSSIRCEQLRGGQYLAKLLLHLFDVNIDFRYANSFIERNECRTDETNCVFRLVCKHDTLDKLRCTLILQGEDSRPNIVNIEMNVCIVVCDVCEKLSECLVSEGISYCEPRG